MPAQAAGLDSPAVCARPWPALAAPQWRPCRRLRARRARHPGPAKDTQGAAPQPAQDAAPEPAQGAQDAAPRPAQDEAAPVDVEEEPDWDADDSCTANTVEGPKGTGDCGRGAALLDAGGLATAPPHTAKLSLRCQSPKELVG